MNASRLSLVREVVLAHAPSTVRESDLRADLALGPSGLGLDSVTIVELLVALEHKLGVAIPAELVLGPLTVGKLAELVERPV